MWDFALLNQYYQIIIKSWHRKNNFILTTQATLKTIGFGQVTDILIETDHALFLAYLFLCFNENKWMRKIDKIDKDAVRKFAYILRFNDSFKLINDDELAGAQPEIFEGKGGFCKLWHKNFWQF